MSNGAAQEAVCANRGRRAARSQLLESGAPEPSGFYCTWRIPLHHTTGPEARDVPTIFQFILNFVSLYFCFFLTLPTLDWSRISAVKLGGKQREEQVRADAALGVFRSEMSRYRSCQFHVSRLLLRFVVESRRIDIFFLDGAKLDRDAWQLGHRRAIIKQTILNDVSNLFGLIISKTLS